jgi:hypothetical protein
MCSTSTVERCHVGMAAAESGPLKHCANKNKTKKTKKTDIRNIGNVPGSCHTDALPLSHGPMIRAMYTGFQGPKRGEPVQIARYE